eukprot:3412736-Alexandrium_andersonii.AAC.1
MVSTTLRYPWRGSRPTAGASIARLCCTSPAAESPPGSPGSSVGERCRSLRPVTGSGSSGA